MAGVPEKSLIFGVDLSLLVSSSQSFIALPVWVTGLPVAGSIATMFTLTERLNSSFPQVVGSKFACGSPSIANWKALVTWRGERSAQMVLPRSSAPYATRTS